MKLVIFVTNSDHSLESDRAKFKNEIQKSGAFTVGDVTHDLSAALRAAAELRCTHLLLEAARDERRFTEQIEEIVRCRRNSKRRLLSNVVIISPKVSEYAMRRFSDANIMLGFIRPSRPDRIALDLEELWGDNENGLWDAPDNAGCVKDGDGSAAESIKALLNRLEIPSCYIGYRYLIDAVQLVLLSREQRTMTKTVYPSIGAKYNKSPRSVERAIRFLLPAAYNSRGWRRLFPEFKELPSNSKFICALADIIEKH